MVMWWLIRVVEKVVVLFFGRRPWQGPKNGGERGTVAVVVEVHGDDGGASCGQLAEHSVDPIVDLDRDGTRDLRCRIGTEVEREGTDGVSRGLHPNCINSPFQLRCRLEDLFELSQPFVDTQLNTTAAIACVGWETDASVVEHCAHLA